MYAYQIEIPDEELKDIRGLLCIPAESKAIIILVHGSGSDRFSIRNNYISKCLNEAGFATLLVDLLTEEEKEIDRESKHLRYNIYLLTKRVVSITKWVSNNRDTQHLQIGYLSSSTGTAAALNSLAYIQDIGAVVSRGGRIDLCIKDILQKMKTPVLLTVGSRDEYVLNISKNMIKESKSTLFEFTVIPGASHYFEEEGTIDIIVKLSISWFNIHLLKHPNRFVNPFKENLLDTFRRSLGSRLRMRFQNRISAAQILANMLSSYSNNKDVIIVGILRGGVIIADIIAEKLPNADFGLVISKRLRNPHNSETAIGSILHDGSIYMNPNLDGISRQYIQMEISHQREKLTNQINFFGLQDYKLDCHDRVVILVDDGADTGSTIISASKLINSQKPTELVVALPVLPKQIISLLYDEVKKIEYIRAPKDFRSVEEYYKDYSQVEESEILAILKNRLTYHSTSFDKIT